MNSWGAINFHGSVSFGLIHTSKNSAMSAPHQHFGLGGLIWKSGFGYGENRLRSALHYPLTLYYRNAQNTLDHPHCFGFGLGCIEQQRPQCSAIYAECLL